MHRFKRAFAAGLLLATMTWVPIALAQSGPGPDNHSGGCPTHPNYPIPGGWPKAEIIYPGNSIGYADFASGGVTYRLVTAGGGAGLWIVDNPCTRTLRSCGSTSLTDPETSCFVPGSSIARQVVVGYHTGFGAVPFVLTKS